MTQIEKEKLQKRQHLKKVIFRVVNICSYVLALLFIIVLIVSGAKSCSKTSNKQVKQVNDISLVQRDVAYLKDDDGLYYNSYNDLFDYCHLVYDENYSNSDNIVFATSTSTWELYLDDYDGLTYSFQYNGTVEFLLNVSEGYEESYISYNDGSDYQLIYSLVFSIDTYNFDFSCLKEIYYDTGNESYTGRELYNLGINVNGAFTTLSDSSVSFIETLNNGLTDLFAIFYDDGVTTLGYLVLIVVGVSLCWVTFRLISGLIRIRG